MPKPVIVCDIDDVVFPFIPEVARHFNDRFGASLTAKDFVSYNFYEVWGGSQAEANAIIDHFLSLPKLEVMPIKGAQEAFARLTEDFTLVMVTARNGIFEEPTTKWLRTHFAELFSHVIFAGNPHDGRDFRSKGEICKELGAALIIDDHPSNVASALLQGVDGILFGEQAWTVEAKVDGNVVRCRDWKAVEEYIYGAWRQQRFS